MGIPIQDPIYTEEQKALRWSSFKNEEPETMYRLFQKENGVFDFIQNGSLKADQITFINTLISYLTTNGIIDKQMLFHPPFTDVNDQRIIGVFDYACVGKIVSIIDRVNGNADLGVG